MGERILCESPLVRVTALEGLEPCDRLPVYVFRGKDGVGSGPCSVPGEERRPKAFRDSDLSC